MYLNAMECPICYTNEPTYVVNCGSSVEHKVCDQCEVQMRMKEPATRKGRGLKCPMCRVPEKEPGKRTEFSYKYELEQLYAASYVSAYVPRAREPANDWRLLADTIRDLPLVMQERYIRMYPQLAPYFDMYVPVTHPASRAIRPSRTIPESVRQPFAARVAPENRAAMRPPEQAIVHAFCQSGNRETGVCHTRSKTKRKCSHAGCTKFVCRSCRQCLTH